MRLSISSPIRSTRPSATAESYRDPSSAWAATDAVISSRSLTFTRTRYIAYSPTRQGIPGDPRPRRQAGLGRKRRDPERDRQRAPCAGAPKAHRGIRAGQAEPRDPFGWIRIFFFLLVRPGGDRRMAAMLANWRDGHHRCGHGRRNSGAGCRRAVRTAQAGGDLPQGAEQAAVRADTAGERPRRRAQCRAVRRTDRARGGARAARGPRRPTPGGARRGRGPGGVAVRRRAGDRPGLPRAARADRTPEAATAAAVALTGADSGAFAVRARRRDKRFPLTSEQLTQIGAEIQAAHGLPVTLEHPDTRGLRRGRPARGVRVHRGPAGAGRPAGRHERPRGRADVRRHRLAGRGLPVMKRGLRCVFLHFSGVPLTGPSRSTRRTRWSAGSTGSRAASRLYVVPFGKAQQSLAASGAGRLQVMAQRRLMLKTARCSPPAERVGAGHRRLARPGVQPDAAEHHRARRRGRAADPAAAARLGQDRDHGGGAAPRHAGDLRAARRGLLHAAHAAPRGDPGEDATTCTRSRGASTWRSSPSGWPPAPRSTGRLTKAG